eukprot:SAG11_NODE_5900_length_1436_cov_2.426756_1_plen_63_part_00
MTRGHVYDSGTVERVFYLLHLSFYYAFACLFIMYGYEESNPILCVICSYLGTCVLFVSEREH